MDEFVVREGSDHERREVDPACDVALEDGVAHVPAPCGQTLTRATALTRFRRALERRHIFGAEIAAKEMGYVSLHDALGLLALYAAEDSPKYGKAATRWLGRLALSPTVSR